jgi:ABC-type multidrug transport system ATPase subunit
MVEPLQLHGVSKRYGPRGPWVLRGIDLELAPGSLTRVDGANGSGKSTLLALVAGIGRPSRGRVTGGGRKAYVPERLPAVLPYTVTDYLLRLGAFHGLVPGEALRRATYWLDRLGAAAWSRAPMAALSMGTAQKIALTQALMADADLLVLDEAWTGLDADARAVLDRAVAERLAAGTTVVFVDHQHAARSGYDPDVRVVRDGTVVRGARPGTPPRPPGTTPATAPATTLPTYLDLVEIEFEDGAAQRTIHVRADASDDALREVLARPQSHVRSVRPLVG